jgi:hypothetical protein
MVFCSGVSFVIQFWIICSVLRKCGMLLKLYALGIVGCNTFNLMLQLCLVVSFHQKVCVMYVCVNAMHKNILC